MMNSCRHFEETVVCYSTPVCHGKRTAAGSMVWQAFISLNPLLCCVASSCEFKNVLNNQPHHALSKSKYGSK